MTIKRLIGTINAAALGEDRAKIRAEYIESDSISSIMSCLRRDDDVQSQSTSEAISLKDRLVSAKDLGGAAPDGRHSLEPTVPALVQGVRVRPFPTVCEKSSSRPPCSPLHVRDTVGNSCTRTP